MWQSNDLDSINFCSGGSRDGTLGEEATGGQSLGPTGGKLERIHGCLFGSWIFVVFVLEVELWQVVVAQTEGFFDGKNPDMYYFRRSDPTGVKQSWEREPVRPAGPRNTVLVWIVTYLPFKASSVIILFAKSADRIMRQWDNGQWWRCNRP